METQAPPSLQPKGYHKLAMLMGPNTEVAIFRRFGTLNMFTLLFMQAELMELERQFTSACLDDAASDIGAINEYCSNFVKLRKNDQQENRDQLQMLQTIRQKLQDYSTLSFPGRKGIIR